MNNFMAQEILKTALPKFVAMAIRMHINCYSCSLNVLAIDCFKKLLVESSWGCPQKLSQCLC